MISKTGIQGHKYAVGVDKLETGAAWKVSMLHLHPDTVCRGPCRWSTQSV